MSPYSLVSPATFNLAGLVVEDAADLKIFDSGFDRPNSASPVAWLKDVSGAFIQWCQATKGTKTFLPVDGAKSAAILVAENDFSQATTPVDVGSTVPAGAVRVREGVPR